MFRDAGAANVVAVHSEANDRCERLTDRLDASAFSLLEQLDWESDIQWDTIHAPAPPAAHSKTDDMGGSPADAPICDPREENLERSSISGEHLDLGDDGNHAGVHDGR